MIFKLDNMFDILTFNKINKLIISNCISYFDFSFGSSALAIFSKYLYNNKQEENYYILLSHSIDNGILNNLNIFDENIIFSIVDKNNHRNNLNYSNIFSSSANVFHSKLYIKISMKSISIIFGSGNLTKKACYCNSESMIAFQVYDHSPFNIKLLSSKILLSALECFNISKSMISTYLPNWYKLIDQMYNIHTTKYCYIHNFKKSLLDQIFQYVGENEVFSCEIFSPTFPSEGITLVDYFKKNYSGNQYRLYQINYINNLFNHSKIYLFNFKEKKVIFIGSPNASRSSFCSFGNNIVENGLLICV